MFFIGIVLVGFQPELSLPEKSSNLFFKEAPEAGRNVVILVKQDVSQTL
jgi:hypothetical protein